MIGKYQVWFENEYLYQAIILSFMPKITETDIIKRTALLKFLQILDGFHTPTEKNNLIFFSYSNFEILKKSNWSKILKKLPETIKSEFANNKRKTFFWQTSPIVSPQIKPKKTIGTQLGQKTDRSKIMRRNPELSYCATSKLKINDKKLSLSIKNFWNPLIWPKKLKTTLISQDKLKNKFFYLGPFNSWWDGLNQNHQRLVDSQVCFNERKFYNNNIFFSRKPRISEPKIDQRNWIVHSRRFSAFASTLYFPICWYISPNIQNIPKMKRQTESRSLSNYQTSIFPKKQPFSPLRDPFNRFKHLLTEGLLFKLTGHCLSFLVPVFLKGRGEASKIQPRPYYLSRFATPIKKTNVFESILQTKGIPKWEIYLKNQSSNKSLNLLCVWPSYLEDIFGPFNLNDSGSYILPEYFQLLGHGPKLKKQGITLIASTNNLTNLDAALLRPGRFDTIINFSYSFSSIDRSSKIIKHLASLTQNNEFSYYKLYTREKKYTLLGINSPIFHYIGGKPLKSKEPGIKRSTDFRRSNIWALKNNFYLQFTSFDKANQPTPIKTFLDVSIFIHHKLWWSFHNKKLLWPGLDQKSTRVFPTNTDATSFLNLQKGEHLMQKSRTQVSNAEKFKTLQATAFEFNIDNGLLVLPSKLFVKLKDLTNIFRDILQIIYLRFFYNIFKFFIIFRNLLKNQKMLTSQSSSNQNFDSLTVLSREVLISKMLTLGLSKKLNSLTIRESSPSTVSLSETRQAEPDDFLQIYNVPKIKTFNLTNHKKTTIHNFRSNLDNQDNNVFLKSNRSFLFCTGDFNYKISREKNDSIVLLKEKSSCSTTSKEKQSVARPSPTLPKTFGRERKNLWLALASGRFWSRCRTDLSSNEVGGNNFSHNLEITNSFLDPSSKTWKPLQATAVKNVKINHVKLTKYNQIYKLKKIESKQFFFNLHPFTCLILKRWLEITKANKLKRYLKVSLIKNILPQFNLLLYSKNKQNSSIMENFWFLNSQTNILNKKSSHNKIYDNLYSMTLLTPINNSLLGQNTQPALADQRFVRSLPTNPFFSTHESYLLKKLSTNSSLNISCLQTYETLMDLKHKNWVSSLDLPQIHSRLKKIPRKIMYSNKHCYFQDRCKIKTFNVTKDKLEMNNQIVLLKNPKEFLVPDLVSPKMKKLFVQAKRFDYPSTRLPSLLLDQTSLSKNKAAALARVSDLTKQLENIQNYKMCRLDISFFLLTFYIMFFEKIQTKNVDFLTTFLSMFVSKQNKDSIAVPMFLLNMKSWGNTPPNKITLNTIKIFMPYKSLIVSHFLLSQSNTYDFSCKNFEILIYNKFKNFLVDF